MKGRKEGDTVEDTEDEGWAPAVSLETINESIHEYLLKCGYFETVDALHDEIATKQSSISYFLNKPEPSAPQNFGESYIIQAFESGLREEFFVCWRRFLPMHIREQQVCKKLEFYLQVYFTVYPIHPSNPKSGNMGQELRQQMEHFKEYLDERGQDLSQTNEFLGFYALPYVPNPDKHPSFRQVFTPKWVTDLRVKLLNFIQHFLPPMDTPLLLKMYTAYSQLRRGNVQVYNQNAEPGQPGNKSPFGHHPVHSVSMISALNMNTDISHNDIMAEEYIALKEQYDLVCRREDFAKSKLLESHAKWTMFARDILSIAKELFIQSEENQPSNGISDLGEEVSNKYRIRIQKYDDFLEQNLVEYREQAGGTPMDIMERLGTVATNDDGVRDQSPISVIPGRLSFDESSQAFSLPPLKYTKIKDYLVQGESEDLKLCALLQALRWRITRSRHGYPRKQVLHANIHYDLLGCHEKTNMICHTLLKHQNRKVVEYAVCLINVLASESLGSGYLVQNEKLINLLVDILFQEAGDTNLRQNALGALQKFSLRRRPQSIMIELDLIGWIINVLKTPDNLSDYSLEYVTALLMNLVLRTPGKDKCEDSKLEVLKVLNELLEQENTQVRTYINGTLYSILTRPTLKEQAKAMGMPEMLQILMENSEEQLARQIQYILQQLENEQSEELMSDDTEDYLEAEEDDEYETEQEEEIDEEIANADLLTGEELLMNEFVASMEEGLSQTKEVTERMVEHTQHISRVGHSDLDESRSQISEKILFRPSTPISMIPSIPATGRNVPSALKSRPRIPRTPLNPERLSAVHKENREILAQAHYVKRTQGTKSKKKLVEGSGTKEGEEEAVVVQEARHSAPPPPRAVPPSVSPSRQSAKGQSMTPAPKPPREGGSQSPEGGGRADGNTEENMPNSNARETTLQEVGEDNERESDPGLPTHSHHHHPNDDDFGDGGWEKDYHSEMGQTKEHVFAFQSRIKIVRTPPELSGKKDPEKIQYTYEYSPEYDSKKAQKLQIYPYKIQKNNYQSHKQCLYYIKKYTHILQYYQILYIL